MAATVWVYKQDGTVQCETGPGIPLAEMQKELQALGATVLKAEKRQHCGLIPAGCGLPTAQVNAYEISAADWKKILRGFVGPNGFRLWTCDFGQPQEGEVSIPELSSVTANPVLVRELIGRPCRPYRQGDALTKDFVPSRVNIELTANDVIADIWYG